MNILSTFSPDILIAIFGIVIGSFITAAVLISTCTHDKKDMILTMEKMDRGIALADKLLEELVEENKKLKTQLEISEKENASLKEELNKWKDYERKRCQSI